MEACGENGRKARNLSPLRASGRPFVAAGQGQADKMDSVAAFSSLFKVEIRGRILKLTEVVTGTGLHMLAGGYGCYDDSLFSPPAAGGLHCRYASSSPPAAS